MTLIRGAGPPESIVPGLERFAGIGAALGMLLLVSLVVWPATRPPA